MILPKVFQALLDSINNRHILRFPSMVVVWKGRLTLTFYMLKTVHETNRLGDLITQKLFCLEMFCSLQNQITAFLPIKGDVTYSPLMRIASRSYRVSVAAHHV